MAGAIRVEGLKEFQRACNKSSKDVKAGLKTRLLRAGEIVAADARQRFMHIDARSAASMRPRVRGGRVVVEQSKRRTTGLHPKFGAMQMGIGFMPALEAKSDEVTRDLEDMLGDLVNGF